MPFVTKGAPVARETRTRAIEDEVFSVLAGGSPLPEKRNAPRVDARRPGRVIDVELFAGAPLVADRGVGETPHEVQAARSPKPIHGTAQVVVISIFLSQKGFNENGRGTPRRNENAGA